MTRSCLGIVLALSIAATVAGAGEPAPATDVAGEGVRRAAAAPSDWEFEVVPYGWISGVYGSLDVGGRTAHVSVTPLDLLEIVFDGDALAAGAYASARWRRFSVFVDAFGGGVKSDERVTVPTPRCALDVDAKVTVNQVFVDLGLGADVGRWALAGRRRPLTLGVYAGMRYVHLGSKIRATAAVDQLGLESRTNATVTFDWADPLIGVRFEVPLHDRLSLDFRGDIGGFGASSDLIWGLAGGARYWMEWNPRGIRPWVGLGYRLAAFDRSGADGRATVEMQFRGPTSSLGFVF
jgi:hypothetical protein